MIEKLTNEEPRGYFGLRHIQFLLLFIGLTLSVGMRANLSVGVVAMTSKVSDNPDVPVYPKLEEDKEIMLSSFFWGYICLQIGAAELAQKFGPKRFLTIAIAIAGLFTILIPIMSQQLGSTGVIICRVIQGLTQGFLLPSIHHIISNWSSVKERAKIVAFVYSGSSFGTGLSMIVTGSIASSWSGWPTAFYLNGGLGLLWCIIFFLFSSDSPEEYKRISDKELKYIKEGAEKAEHKQVPNTPWKSIVTSLPLWANLMVHCSAAWNYWTLLNEIPTYLNKMCDLDVANDGLLSAAPYFVLYLISVGLSPIADYLIAKKYTSVIVSRRIFTGISCITPSIALVILSFINKGQAVLAVILLAIAVGTTGAALSGSSVNLMDLSPNYAGTLMAIVTTISSVFALVAPLSVKFLKNQGLQETDSQLWIYIFCFSAAFNSACCVFFLLFSSGEVQPWNDPSKSQRKMEKM